MAGKNECLALDVMFVDGRCYENVDFALAKVGNGAFECIECGFSGFLGRSPGVMCASWPITLMML